MEQTKVNKQTKRVVTMRLYRSHKGFNQVLKDDKGKVVNENHTVKIVYVNGGENSEFNRYTDSIPRLGFIKVEVEDAKIISLEDGFAVKEDEDKELFEIATKKIESIFNPQEEMSDEDKKLKALEDQNKLLMEQLEAMKAMGDNVKVPADSEDDRKKELRAAIKEKGGKSQGLNSVESLERRLEELSK